MFCSCGNVVTKEKPDASIGMVVLIRDDDCCEPMCNLNYSGFACHYSKECRRVWWVALDACEGLVESCGSIHDDVEPV